MRTITSAPATIDVLGIGNSLIAAGFDPGAIERVFHEAGQRCIAVNGGLGATGGIEHLALARLAMNHHSVKTLIYGFFDQQISNNVIETNSDLFGNRSMLYYQEPELAWQYAHFNMLNRAAFQLYRSSAMLRERGAIWAKVEKLRRAMGSIGMPPAETNQFGRKLDFDLLESPDTTAFVAACQKVIHSGVFLNEPVQLLLRQAREQHVRVLVAEMPVHPLHLHRFYAEPIWAVYTAQLRAAVQTEGATYLDASGWIPDADLFADHLHLSKEGAKQFSRHMAEYLLAQSNR